MFCISTASAQQYYLLQTVSGTGGGSHSSSGSYVMDATVGQPVVEKSSGGGGGGFWNQYEGLEKFFKSAYAVSDGWNLISVGNTVGDYRKSVLFPSASSGAFGYQGAYIVKDTLQNGKGYWLKFPGNQFVEITGTPRETDTVTVVAGWNLIGSGSGSISTASIIQIPSGIVTTQYFGYSTGYSPSLTIEPGRGYWVKTSAGGKLVLNVPPAFLPVAAHTEAEEEFSGLNQLTITPQDAKGRSQKLMFGKAVPGNAEPEAYEMPPVAPKGAIDVRFATNQFAEFFSSEKKEVPIAIQSNGTPLELSWTLKEQSGLSYILVEKKGEKVVAEHKLKPGGKFVLKNTEKYNYSLRVEEVPSSYALEQNYPNPFNPSTVIRYQLPATGHVTLKIYDMLGREVSTLVDGELEAGHQSVEWTAANVASGVYFYRLQARETGGQAVQFTETKKLMLVR